MLEPPLVLLQYQEKVAELLNSEAIKLLENKGWSIYYHAFHYGRYLLLKKNLPLVFKYLGVENFQQKIAQPYFKNKGFSHWSKDQLFTHFGLLDWAKENYLGSDKEIVLQMLYCDLIYKKSSLALKKKVTEEDCFKTTLSLQPHVVLYHGPNFFTLRKKIMENSRAFIPDLTDIETGYFIIFRNTLNKVVHEALDQKQFLFLSLFSESKSCFQALENGSDENLESWFYLMVKRGILA